MKFEFGQNPRVSPLFRSACFAAECVCSVACAEFQRENVCSFVRRLAEMDIRVQRSAVRYAGPTNARNASLLCVCVFRRMAHVALEMSQNYLMKAKMENTNK